jgi:uncharacterized membrane protein
MQFNRPRLNLPITKFDKLLDNLGVVLLLIHWTATIIFYFYLPNSIPIHFNAKGVVDGYGNKATVFLLPIIVTMIYIGLSYLNRYPHIFNYPTTITEGNARQHYTAATKMIQLLKLVIVVSFMYINLCVCLVALGKVDGLGWWFLPLFIVAIISVIVYYFLQIKK